MPSRTNQDLENHRNARHAAHSAEHRAVQRAESGEQHTASTPEPGFMNGAQAAQILGRSQLGGRGNGPVRAAMIQQIQKTQGNRAAQRFLQRAAEQSALPAIQRCAGCRDDTEVQSKLEGAPVVQRAQHKQQPEEEGELLKERLHTHNETIQRAQHKQPPEDEGELLKERPHVQSWPVQRAYAGNSSVGMPVQRLPSWLGGGKKTGAATGTGATTTTPAVKIPSGTQYTAGKHVTPNFKLDKPSPKRSNSDSSTMKPSDPTFKGNVAVDAGAKVWRFQVDSVEGKGKMQIVYYSKDHYPAPSSDSGPLSNVTKDNYQAIITNLQANRTGVADDWSAYDAEDLHEDYHWKVEWQGAVKPEVTAAENAIAALQVDFTAAPSASKAKAVLAPQANTLFKNAMKRAKDAFWALGDSPGDPPYVAQAPAIDALTDRVRAYATGKGW